MWTRRARGGLRGFPAGHCVPGPWVRGGEDGKAPIVDDQHIHAGDGLEDAFMAAPISRTGATGKSEGFEHAR